MRRVPLFPIVGAVMRHPALWAEAVRTAGATARHGWWRRPPFLPLPDKDYVRWRIATAYGSPDGPVEAADVVAYLQWRRRQRITR